MRKKNRIRSMMAIIIIPVVLAFVGIKFFGNTSYILAPLFSFIGIYSFYSFIILGISEKGDNLSKTDLRLAITLSSLTLYFVLLGVGAFYGREEMPAYPRMLISHFTTIIGVIIAFYFGTEAYIAVKTLNKAEGK